MARVPIGPINPTLSFFSGFTEVDITVATPLSDTRYIRIVTTSIPAPEIRVTEQVVEGSTAFFNQTITESNRIFTPFNTIKMIQTEEGNDIRHIHVWIEAGFSASYLFQNVPNGATVTAQYYTLLGTIPDGQNAISYDRFFVRNRLVKEYESSKRVDVVDFGRSISCNLVFTGISLETLALIKSLYLLDSFLISMSSGSLLDPIQDAFLAGPNDVFIDTYGREPFRLQDIYEVTCSNYFDPILYDSLTNTGSSINLSITSIRRTL